MWVVCTCVCVYVCLYCMCIHADAKGKHQVAYSIYAASTLTQESSSMPRTLLSSFDAGLGSHVNPKMTPLGLEEEERT